MTNLLFTILGGLIVAGIGRYFMHGRLAVVTNYLAFSELAPGGKTVLFTILNRGHRTEEEVALELDPSRAYAMLAATSSFVTMRGNVVSLARLSALDSVQVIVLVEHGDFDDSKVLSIASRQTKGKKKSRIEEVPQAPGVNVVGLVAVFVMMVAPAYGALFFVTHDETFRKAAMRWTGAEVETAPAETAEATEADNPPAVDPIEVEKEQRAAALRAAGWRGIDRFLDSPAAKIYSGSDFPITVEYLRRQGNFVHLEVTLTNKSSEWMEVTATINSTAAKPQDDYSQDYLADVMVLPGSVVTREMTVYLPPKTTPPLVRAEFHIDSDSFGNLYGLVKVLDLSSGPKTP